MTEVLRRVAARHHPDGSADRLHRRPRDDQPAGPGRVLRGVVPQLRDATVGAGAAVVADPASLLRRSRWGPRPRRARRCAVDFFVDVSRVFETKRRMLACHASQRDWLLRQHGIDEYLEMQARWGASRGAEIGVAQAEAFRQYRGHPYPTIISCRG